eukprot:scaffold762_cov363-Pavlova_lutheri.AAC.84
MHIQSGPSTCCDGAVERSAHFQFLQANASVDTDNLLSVAYESAKSARGWGEEDFVPILQAFKECLCGSDMRVSEFRKRAIHNGMLWFMECIIRKDPNKTVQGLQWCSSPVK